MNILQTKRARLPKIIWMLWLQGWSSSPSVARASLASWQHRNPGWRLNALDQDRLSRFIPAADLARIIAKELEAASDQIRLELLHRYGGVWADATTICARPLDDWLHDVMESGFFAFASPGPDRMLASWFLAAEKGSYAVERWRAAAVKYWSGRETRDDYFWVHNLFAEVYRSDPAFRTIWDGTPVHSARHPFHFGPNNTALSNPLEPAYRQALEDPPAPVFKLTHKGGPEYGPGSLMAAICTFGQAGSEAVPIPRTTEPKRILVGWYGSFAGHGTIGDLRSLESVMSHLVALGHVVLHATTMDLEIPGAARVDWKSIDPATVDGVLFVCGPILKNHRQTQEFFAHFALASLAGIGVSLLPEGDPNRHNPFRTVFARQGDTRQFGDVAIVAPLEDMQETLSAPEPVIGVALRGAQSEYGVERCLWRETEVAVRDIVQTALEGGPGKVITIENHLARSGLSPAEIEQQYCACNLVITSRFHGAVTAMRHCIPFIAIDQIRGGAKVYDLLIGLGWPHIHRIDQIDIRTLCRTARDLLQGEDRSALIAARNKAVAEANHTLAQIDGWAASLRGPRSRPT